MTIVFFSNILNHHQVALCDELYAVCGKDFIFVELTNKLLDERLKMGFTAHKREYVVSGSSNPALAAKLAIDADVAIIGAESFRFLKQRILNNPQGITFSYSERWLKKGLINFFSPAIFRQLSLYLQKGWRRKWYMLCANGFLAKDLYRMGLFKQKCFKWGYFPQYPELQHAPASTGKPVAILWVARFIDWKNPEIMVKLAEELLRNGYNFTITMIGDGPERDKILSILSRKPVLSKFLKLPGNRPNKEVIEEMRNSDIFCITSNRREGWGAVLGEAMASGCCPVASSEAGATPFLVENNINGVVYKTGSLSDLLKKVVFLLENPEKRKRMGLLAQQAIYNHWSAPVAARNFLALAKAKYNSTTAPDLTNEPGSIIKNS